MEGLREILSQNQKPSLSYAEQLEQGCKWANDEVGALTGYDCPICKNKGFTYHIKNDQIIARECKCNSIRKSLSRINKSGLSNALGSMNFDSYETKIPIQEQIKSLALSYCEDETDAWFFIGGQVGSGKTHICTTICGKALEQGKSVLYMLWKDASTELKANAMDPYKYNDLIMPYKSVDLLYIDDFLKSPKNAEGKYILPTPGDLKLAFEIINFRYQSGMKTIISTEWRAMDLVDVEESVESRIYQRSKGYQITVPQNKDYNYRLN